MTEASASEAPAPDRAQQIVDREKKFLLQNYGRYPLALDRGKGAYLYDFNGKRYLDLITGIGVNALGHGHPRLLRVLKEQAGRLIHCSNLYYHEYQGALAEIIARVSGLDRTFFCNSGTEAMEGGIKMMRAHGHRTSLDKYEIISFENSFHGRSTGALALTGQPKYRKDFEPLMPGVRFVPFNDEAALEAAVSERTCGIAMELVQGEGGIHPVSDSMVRKARELADRYDALLLFDEIQCGVGRPGAYFSYQGYSPVVMPDIMVAAKPLALGLPLGIVTTNEKAAPSLAAGMHGSTFGGGALACRVAIEFFAILEELLPQIRSRSDYFRAKLENLRSKYAFVKEVRVRGLMIGLELTIPGKQFVTDAIANGLLINCTHETVLRFLPPYTISEKEIDQAIRILDRLFKAVRPDPASPTA